MTTSLLDSLMPQYQFSERHSVWLDAPPEEALTAARLVTLREMPVARLLFGIRALPALVRGRHFRRTPNRPLVDLMFTLGFVDLGEIPGREFANGVIGQMWNLTRGESPAIEGPEDFVAFVRPGFAKAAMSFSARLVDGRCELTTETRVLATDEASRRAFARYWFVIHAGSALIRRSWLRAARQRALPRPGGEVRRRQH